MASGTLRHTASLATTLARSEFKLRYAGSALGFFWSASKPLALFGILYFAFSYVLRFGEGVDNYPLQLLLAIVLWMFFAEATAASTVVLVARADIIRKISFPRIVLPLSVAGTAMLATVFNLLAVFLICGIVGVYPTLSWLWLLPLLAELVILTTGTSLLLAGLYVRFRDVGQIWELLLQLVFYSTPIIYPVTLIPEHIRGVVLANPLAQIIQDARGVVINPATGTGLEQIPLAERVIPFVLTIVIFVAGWFVFRRAAARAAEFV